MADPYWDPYFEKSLVRGPLKGFNGYWPASYFLSVRPPAWPDEYINIQYEDSYADGGQWFCPDNRTVRNASKCIPGYPVGQYQCTLSDLPVNTDAPTSPPVALVYPPKVHFPPVDLTVTFGESIYSIQAFDPDPDFMQVFLGFSPGSFLPYHNSCYIDPTTGQRKGCGRYIFEHPASSLHTEVDYPWRVRRGPPDGETLGDAYTPDEDTGNIECSNVGWSPDGSSDSPDQSPDSPAGETWWDAPFPLTDGLGGSIYQVPASMSAISDIAIYPNGTQDTRGVGEWLEYNPEALPDTDAFYEGEPDNTAKYTLWPFQAINHLLASYTEGGTTYGRMGGELYVAVAFYWYIDRSPEVGTLAIGDVRHAYRRIRGGRIGSNR